MERQGLRNKVEEEKHLEIHGGSKEHIGIKLCLHGTTDYAKKLKPRFPVVWRRRTWLEVCACVAQRYGVGLTWSENVKQAWKNGMR